MILVDKVRSFGPLASLHLSSEVQPMVAIGVLWIACLRFGWSAVGLGSLLGQIGQGESAFVGCCPFGAANFQ